MTLPPPAVRLRPSANCGISRCEPGWEWRPRPVDHDLWFVVQGRGHAAYEGDHFDLHPGSLLWLRPGTTGHFTQDLRHRLTVVACHFSLLDAAGAEAAVAIDDLPGPYVEVTDIAPLATLLRRVVRVMRTPSGWALLEAEGLLLQAVATAWRDGRPDQPDSGVDPRLAEAMDLITMDPAARPRLAEVAARVGSTPRQLSRLFREQAHTNFRDFLVESRLQRAHTLLAESLMPVTAVAEALGYPDHVLFSRQFRARFGQPPSALRRTV